MPLLPVILGVQVANRHYIRFPMEDGRKIVTVHIAAGWLRERASRDLRSSRNMALLYSLYREEIEAAASEKYDRSHRDGADIVVIASDLL